MTSENAAPNYLRPPLNGHGIGDYTLHDFVSKWMMQQDDIAEIGRYASANSALKARAPSKPRIVLLGDSITEFWNLGECRFEAAELVNRGIAGQNSSQMLLRFEDDVVDLEPAAVVLLCGTNDLRSYVGDPADLRVAALARIRRNVAAMSDIARAHGIHVVLCAIPPVGADRERVARDSGLIRAVNERLAGFAESRGHLFADYHAALLDEGGNLGPAFSDDGVHPNANGYGLMWPILEETLRNLPIDLWP
jgi:acyl-CoA thioesterase-1